MSGARWKVCGLAGAPAMALAAGLLAGANARSPELVVWTLRADELTSPTGVSFASLRVGSLQKPFVARAWALSHPDREPPEVLCDASSGCWRRDGHGRLGLSQAIAQSCNTYFATLARATPQSVLRRTLEDTGFSVPEGELSPECAIGLAPAEEACSLVIAPRALLQSYRRLVREAWPAGESIRQRVMEGMRAAARDGTAQDLAPPGWAKTGTTDGVDGRPLTTSGLVVHVDETATCALALLPHGTGREAAAALDLWKRGHVPGSSAGANAGARIGAPSGIHDRVRVLVFSRLRPRRVRAKNLGARPVRWSGGWIGPGATVELGPGHRVAHGSWELGLPEVGLTRSIEGELDCGSDPEGRLRLVAHIPTRRYVEGVLSAELRDGSPALCDALAAAVVRFLGDGARHSDADVCDSTHCAWFVGGGPIPEWPQPDRPRTQVAAARCGSIDDARWRGIVAEAARPGPHHWTSHCGGRPLTPHAVWGNGVHRITACPHHGGGATRPWTRRWDDQRLAEVFGSRVTDMDVTWSEDGVWELTVTTADDPHPRRFRYDEAHRLLAGAFGWAGLPSPADGVERGSSCFVAHGVGLGHRVGLCLGGTSR